MPLTEQQRQDFHALAMDYRGAVLLVNAQHAFDCLLAFVEEQIDAQHTPPQVSPTAAPAEGV